MARPAPVLDSFIWGAGGEAMTPEQIARQREIAAALSQQGIDTSPVASWTQGAARVANALAGVVKERRADKAEGANTAANSSILQSLLSGGGNSFPAAPSIGSSSGAQASSGATDYHGDQLAWTDAKPYQKALLNTIAGPESGGRYNVIYGGSKFDDFSRHPGKAVRIQTGPNAGRTSSAAGKYQFLGSTYDDQAKKLGLTDFSPVSQDKAAWNLAAETYKAKTGQDLDAVLQSGDPAAIAQVGKVLNPIWTSLPGGIEQGTNTDRFVATYQKALGAGASPAQATQVAQQEQAQDPVQVASLDPAAGMTPAPSLATMAPGTTASAYDPSGLPPVDPNDPMAPVPQPAPEAMQPNPGPGDPAATTPAGQRVLAAMMRQQPIGGPFQGVEPSLRPFNPGERRPNPDGSYSTEISTTQQQPDGQFVNTPSLWMGQQGPVQFNPNDEQGIMSEAQRFEAQNGPTFPRFPDVQSAEQAAVARSAAGGAGAPQQMAQAAPQDMSQIPVEAGGTAGAIPRGQGGINPAIIEALSNPAASEQTRKIAGMLLGQQMQEQDPLRQLQIQAAQKSLAVPPKQWQKLDDNSLFDPATGEVKQLGAGGGAPKFAGTGLEAQAWNILQSADPGSKEYATAYSIVSQPKTQLVQTENGMMPVEVPPQLPAWLTPPGGGAPAAPTGAPAASGSAPTAAQPGGVAGTAIPGTKKPPTEAQLRNQQLYSVVAPEAKIVEDNFNALTELGNQAGGSVPLAGNYLTSPEYQRATASLKTIIASYLYSTSGATASPKEVDNQADVLTPKPGESVASINDKRARIKTMVDAIRIASGQPAGQPAQDQPAGAPQPGMVEDGFRFKGGDPAAQSNWEPVQ